MNLQEILTTKRSELVLQLLDTTVIDKRQTIKQIALIDLINEQPPVTATFTIDSATYLVLNSNITSIFAATYLGSNPQSLLFTVNQLEQTLTFTVNN